MSEYWGRVHETSKFIQGYMCQSTGGVCRRQVNFVQGYICQSTGGVCMRQVTLYRVACVRVLGELHETSNFIQGYMCKSIGECVRNK